MGDVYCDLGEYEQALHYRASLEIRRETGDRRGEGWMLHALASVHATQDLPALARDCLAQALAIAEECADAELRRACVQVQDQLSAGQ
jgi:hypothetical protein